MDSQVYAEDYSPLLVYQMVGLLVEACQLFEICFVMSARLALKQPDAKLLEDVVPLGELGKAAKQATSALIRELKDGDLLNEELANRVISFLEKRHRIIHREYLISRWPMHDINWRKTFLALCLEVAAEARDLTHVFAKLLLEWNLRFPQLEESARQRLLIIKDLEEMIRRREKSYPTPPPL